MVDFVKEESMLNKKSLLILLVIMLVSLSSVSFAQYSLEDNTFKVSNVGDVEFALVGLFLVGSDTAYPTGTQMFGLAFSADDHFTQSTISLYTEIAENVEAYGKFRVRTRYGTNDDGDANELETEFKHMDFGVNLYDFVASGVSLELGQKYYNNVLFNLHNEQTRSFLNLSVDTDTMAVNTGFAIHSGGYLWTVPLTIGSNGVTTTNVEHDRYAFYFDINVDIMDMMSILFDVEYLFINTLMWEADDHADGVNKAGKLAGKLAIDVSVDGLLDLHIAERLYMGLSQGTFETSTYLEVNLNMVENMYVTVYAMFRGYMKSEATVDTVVTAAVDYDTLNFIAGLDLGYTLDAGGIMITPMLSAEADLAKMINTSTSDDQEGAWIIQTGATFGLGSNGAVEIPVIICLTNTSGAGIDWDPVNVYVLDYRYLHVSRYSTDNPLTTKIFFKLGMHIGW